MSDTYTNRLGLQQPLNGGDAGTWGQTLNTDLAAIDDAIAGTAPINLAGLTSYSVTAVQGQEGALYQARYQALSFTGQINSPCTVTIPQVARMGWAINSTSGGNNVILTTGGGTTLTLPPNGVWVFYNCDGVNVTSPSTQAGPTVINSSGGYLPLLGGYLLQMGIATTGSIGFVTVTFSRAFSATPFIVAQMNEPGGGTSSDTVFVQGKSTTGFSIQLNSGRSGQALDWFAVGPQ